MVTWSLTWRIDMEDTGDTVYMQKNLYYKYFIFW